MSAAVDTNAQREAILGVLTTEPQRLKAISEASGVPLRATARWLSKLRTSRKIVSTWGSTGARSYALPKHLKVVQSSHWRPTKRGDCVNVPRPCPYVGCAHNLHCEVSPRTGAIKFTFPDKEVDQMGESCVLDVAERGLDTLDEVAAVMNLTGERVRQLEVSALRKLEHNARILREFHHD